MKIKLGSIGTLYIELEENNPEMGITDRQFKQWLKRAEVTEVTEVIYSKNRLTSVKSLRSFCQNKNINVGLREVINRLDVHFNYVSKY